VEPRPNELSTSAPDEPVSPAGPPDPGYRWSPPGSERPVANLIGVPGLAFGGVLHRFVALLVDSLIVGIVAIVISIVPLAAVDDPTAASAITTIVLLAVGFAYFILFWTGRRHATPGMRLFKLQVGNAFDGRTLDRGQAVRRWAGLGYPLALLSIVPALGSIGSGITFLWMLALLVSTLASPTKQGLHDRFANSAVVGPAGGSGNALAIGCVLLLVVMVLLPFVAIVSLIFLGGQITDILSDVGTSI
jgi:uncharacterized RDD family membrane protein YckC